MKMMNVLTNPLGKKIFALNLTHNFHADRYSSSRFRPYRESFDICEATWDETVAFLGEQGYDAVLIFVGDGVQYESHPEISLPGAWTKEKLKEKLSAIRALGMEPLPMLDFGAARDAWLGEAANSLSTASYLALAKDLIRELCELFEAPSLFHLGFGKEDNHSQRFKQLRRRRVKEAWFADVNALCQAVRDCKATPWIWADHFLEGKKDFAENVERDVILSTQSYGYIKRFPNGSYRDKVTQSAVELDELGYTQIPANSISESMSHNAITNLELGKIDLKHQPPLGHLVHPLSFTDEDSVFELKYAASNFIYAVQEVYGEESEAK